VPNQPLGTLYIPFYIYSVRCHTKIVIENPAFLRTGVGMPYDDKMLIRLYENKRKTAAFIVFFEKIT
jgi:hypothetical protein